MDADSLENLYYAIAALVVAILTVHGWRQGAGRQFMTLLAIAGAYIVGFFGAGAVAPLIAPAASCALAPPPIPSAL